MLPVHPLTPLYPKSYFFQKDKNVRKQIMRAPDVVETAGKKERRENDTYVLFTGPEFLKPTQEQERPP